jgi:hypothetical protein
MTRARWSELAKKHKFQLLRSRIDSGSITATNGSSYIHIQNNGRGVYNEFERFGLNDVQFLLDVLDDEDIPWLSEHDPGFFHERWPKE